MDIGSENIVAQIIGGTEAGLSDYAAIFILIGGLALALGVIDRLITSFFTKPDDSDKL